MKNKNVNLNNGATTMSEQEKKVYRELVNFYKTHKWVQQENGRWIMVYNPLVKVDDQEGGNNG